MRRHPVQQLKIVLPVVIKALHEVVLNSDEELKDAIAKLFTEASEISVSIQHVCENSHATDTRKVLHAILGLYGLQITALLAKSDLAHEISDCIPILVKLSNSFTASRLSFIGLITGSSVDNLVANILEEEDDNFIGCFSLVNDGASLADARKYGESNDHYHTDFSPVPTGLFLCLQAIQTTTIYAPDPSLRKRAFSALKNVLSDLPSSQQYEILKALIVNDNSSPSMTALLLDIIKDFFFIEFQQRAANDKTNETTLFWGSSALEMIETVLKPSRGGPPSLPEQTEPVLSALNLYRFILLTESTGKTNFSKALSDKSLRKALIDWLLPLQTLISGIEARNREDRSEIAEMTLCSLNPIQLVLHRCIELVEEFLKQSDIARW